MTSTINLLGETLEVMEENGLSDKDVEFIGNLSRTIDLGSWDDFFDAADDIYENWSNEDELDREVCKDNDVVSDLAIFFKNHSIMVRRMNDSGEWWEYIPSKESSPNTTVKMSSECIWTRIGYKNDFYGQSLEDKYRESLIQAGDEDYTEKMSKI